MKRWTIRLVILALLVAAGWYGKDEWLAPDPVPVRTVPVERGLVEATVTNSKAGTIEARRRAHLSPGTAGIVNAIFVERGDRVTEDAVLLRLDDATQAADLTYRKRALSVSHAMHEKAKVAVDRALRELSRNQELRAQELVSLDRLDALESNWQLATAELVVAAAQVEQAHAAVAQAQAELDKTTLRAPFDAIVGEVATELGEWVTPSVPLVSAPHLVDAIDLSSLFVSAPMDEVDAERLRRDLPVRVTIDSHPGRTFSGSIVLVAPFVLEVQAQNRTVEIEVELDDEAFSRSLLPGTSADVEVVLDVRDDVLRIPTYALLEGNRVLVLEDGALVERTVETGVRNWDYVEILSGLDEGARVVTSLDRGDVQPGAEAVEDAGPGSISEERGAVAP